MTFIQTHEERRIGERKSQTIPQAEIAQRMLQVSKIMDTVRVLIYQICPFPEQVNLLPAERM